MVMTAAVAALGAWRLPVPPVLAQAPQWNMTADAYREQAAGVPIETTVLGPTITVLSGPGGNVVVSHGSTGLILVDGFVKPAWPKLRAALDAIDRAPVKTIVNTHWHFDHADNDGHVRAAGGSVVTHENTRKRLMEPHEMLGMHFDPVPSGELPTQTFATSLTLNANGEQIALRHPPAAHTDTDVYVYFPKSNVLHMGDLYFNGQYPFIDVTTGGNIDGVIAAARAALALTNAQTRVVPGHGPVGDRASMQRFLAMITDVRDAVRALKTSGKTLDEVKAAKPTAAYDEAWGKGMTPPDVFVEIVYNTVK
jgi:glyoxylase-like metal-dependent hydrolase (beta-lactamase superfamily II)